MLTFLQNFGLQVVSAFSGWAELFWSNFDLAGVSTWQIVLDIFLVAVIFYWILLFLKGTQAVSVIFGLLTVAFFSLLAQVFDLVALSWLFGYLATMVVVAIPIIFQPELRRLLERLGRPSKISFHDPLSQQEAIQAVISACETLSANKLGSLLVFAKTTSLKEYAETGLKLDAKISPELLISLFQKTSPLHDGAVIIKDNHILAAGAVLPLSLKSTASKWGMRHKSALGLSEQTDAVIVVTSEERGTVSVFSDGHVREHLSPERLFETLNLELLPLRYIKNLKAKGSQHNPHK